MRCPHCSAPARAAGCYAIVRTSHVAVHEVAAALDAGADGVLAPGVGSADAAATVVGAAHYPPVGGRGAAPMVRAAGYGTVAFADYRRQAEDDVVAGVQIEGPDGLGALDAILATATARARLHRPVRSVAAPRRAGRDEPPHGWSRR